MHVAIGYVVLLSIGNHQAEIALEVEATPIAIQPSRQGSSHFAPDGHPGVPNRASGNESRANPLVTFTFAGARDERISGASA